ncbi:hypothetical protein MSG28_002709 [Choristoneura fumiferana]|uniref:Uncharacterized protein n=1 Tax=Choristoneura fumiferana TaxID=7141 RepID=A0ACC0JJ18_CHOFU|nr:hypothetical protein MSG28_002709 [Choristoneura fumiferana]
MLRHDDEEAGYTLYLEHLGGLVPLLKGRRTSKIRPEFVIFDPQGEESVIRSASLRESSSSSSGAGSSSGSGTGSGSGSAGSGGRASPLRHSDSSDTEREEGTV